MRDTDVQERKDDETACIRVENVEEVFSLENVLKIEPI